MPTKYQGSLASQSFSPQVYVTIALLFLALYKFSAAAAVLKGGAFFFGLLGSDG